MARENITLKCSECGEENYIGTRTSVSIQKSLKLKNTAQYARR